jgi:hypothetical protein
VCTLTVAWQAFASHPVVVAANRDERYDRPSAPPHTFEVNGRRVLAPTDEEAGGTWMGYNDAGLFAALTNRWVKLPAGERSRGLLVRDVLGRESAEAAARLVERELDERRYEGFYLLLADANACILLSNDGGTRVTHLDPGVHVVMNVGYDWSYFVPEFRPEPAERQADSGRRLYEALQPDPGESAREWRDRAGTALGDHRFGVCIHGEDESGVAAQFGTVSSSLVTVDADGTGAFHFADGPPCETDFERVEAAF